MPRPCSALLLLASACAAAQAGARLLCAPQSTVGVPPNVTVQTVDSRLSEDTPWFSYIAVDSVAEPLFLYASDAVAHVVRRKRLSTGSWDVVAGSENSPGCQNGPVDQSRLHTPTDLCLLPGAGQRLVVSDAGNFCFRLVDVTAGTVSMLAGSCKGGQGFADGPGPDARFSGGARSLQCLSNCSVLVGDAGSKRLRLITLDGDACSAQPPGTRRRLRVLAAVWLVGGAAVLCALVLAIKTWADDRAAAAAERVRAMRVRAVEADLAQGTRADRRAALAAGRRSHRRRRGAHPLPPLALGCCPDLQDFDSPLLGSPAAPRAATDGGASTFEPDPRPHTGAADGAPTAPSAAQPAACASRSRSAPPVEADPFADLNPLPPPGDARPMCGSV